MEQSKKQTLDKILMQSIATKLSLSTSRSQQSRINSKRKHLKLAKIKPNAALKAQAVATLKTTHL